MSKERYHKNHDEARELATKQVSEAPISVTVFFDEDGNYKAKSLVNISPAQLFIASQAVLDAVNDQIERLSEPERKKYGVTFLGTLLQQAMSPDIGLLIQENKKPEDITIHFSENGELESVESESASVRLFMIAAHACMDAGLNSIRKDVKPQVWEKIEKSPLAISLETAIKACEAVRNDKDGKVSEQLREGFKQYKNQQGKDTSTGYSSHKQPKLSEIFKKNMKDNK